jgi:type III pantothenate kinase
VRVIATGGIANMIDNGIDSIDIVDKQLTLEGLQLIYEKNKMNGAGRGTVDFDRDDTL